MLPLTTLGICSHDPVDDVECVPAPCGSDTPHNPCNGGLQRTRAWTSSSPCSPVLHAMLDCLASTLGDFSRRADGVASRGRRSCGVATSIVPLWGASVGETGVVTPVTVFRVTGCCANHDSSWLLAIVPEFRNREPAFGCFPEGQPPT